MQRQEPPPPHDTIGSRFVVITNTHFVCQKQVIYFLESYKTKSLATCTN